MYLVGTIYVTHKKKKKHSLIIVLYLQNFNSNTTKFVHLTAIHFG
jgi:hypothetical protein